VAHVEEVLAEGVNLEVEAVVVLGMVITSEVVRYLSVLSDVSFPGLEEVGDAEEAGVVERDGQEPPLIPYLPQIVLLASSVFL
jgi:hypothetical protein